MKLINRGGILPSNLLLVLIIPELFSPLYYLIPVGEMCGSAVSSQEQRETLNLQYPGNLETAHRLS